MAKRRPATENTDPNVIRGTIAELTKGKGTILINGKKVDQVTTWAQLQPKIQEAL